MRIFFTDALGNPIFGFRRRHQLIQAASIKPVCNATELASVYYTTTSVNASPGGNSSGNGIARPPTTLFFYIWNKNWDWVLRRCRSHPHEVFQFETRTGDTPLHACCRLNPPPQVVRALLAVPASAALLAPTSSPTVCAFPSASSPTQVLRRLSFSSSHHSNRSHNNNNGNGHSNNANTGSNNNSNTANQPFLNNGTQCPELVYNRDGWTALHVAASNHCSRQVLEVLVEHAPQSISQLTRRTKRAPIHCATASFRGLDRDAFFYLLNISLTQTIEEPNGTHGDDDDHQDESSTEDHSSSSSCNDDDEFYDCQNTKNITKKKKATKGNLAGSNGTNLLCLKDGMGQTPLALLFQKYRERVRHVCQQMDQLQLSRNDALELVQTELGTLWDKARSLVERLSAILSSSEQAAARPIRRHSGDDPIDFTNLTSASISPNSNSQGNRRSSSASQQRRLSSILKFRSESSLQGRRFRLVHASVGLIRFGCPPEMIRLAVSLYPHQVCEVDEDGNLPLHIAAMAFHEQAVATATEAEEMALLSSLDEASSLQTASSHQNYFSYPSTFGNGIASLNNNSNHANNGNWDTMSVISETTTAASTLAGFSKNKSLWDQVFDMLLQQYPDAARTPRQKPQSLSARNSNKNINNSTKRHFQQQTQPPPRAFFSQEDTLPLVLAMRSHTHTMSWKRDGLERLMHAYAPALHFILDGTADVPYKSKTGRSLSLSRYSPSSLCYPHLFALLLAPDDNDNDHLPRSSCCSFRRFTNGRRTAPLRPRSIRMDPSLRRRTPLDIARISAVYKLLQTKPEMIATAPNKNSYKQT